MKNTMCPSPSTATAALALSLLQAPLLPEAQGADTSAAQSNTNMSQVERALVHGSSSDALTIINSSALDGVRPAVVAKELPQVVAKVVKELMEQGKTEDAQRVFRAIRDFSPESALHGALQAFAELDRGLFEKFCDQSIWQGVKPYAGLKEKLVSPAQSTSASPAKTAEMVEVMDKADAARMKAQLGLEAGALCATGIAAASGRASSRSFFSRAVQTLGGALAVAGSAAVFCSIFGSNSSFWSWNSLIAGVSTVITTYGLEQICKGLGLSKSN